MNNITSRASCDAKQYYLKAKVLNKVPTTQCPTNNYLDPFSIGDCIQVESGEIQMK